MLIRILSPGLLVSGLLFLIPVCPAGAQENVVLPADIERTVASLVQQGLKDTYGLQFVEDLTTEIGPRLAGSDAERRARDFAVEALAASGFANVRVEPFEIPFWSRTFEAVSVVRPVRQSLAATALGGSTATPEGGITAPLVRFETLADLEAAPISAVDDRIVFIDEPMIKTMDGSGYRLAVQKRSRCADIASEKGARACLVRSVGTQSHRMPHTGIMNRNGAEGAGPAAAVSGPDADQLTRFLQRGPVDVHLNIQTETKINAPSGNVIAEIAGTDLKDEIVLLACHLDSWDLGTGALDDAAGCGIIIAAARLIADLPVPPRRTIRLVLYGAEEVGLFGASAYARAHGDDLDRHVLAAESDFGAGRIWRFQTRFGSGALEYARIMQGILVPLGIIAGDNNAFGGPDIAILARSGVPVVTPGQNGIAYFDYHHTPDDTFDKIEPDALRQNIAVYAAFTWIAAQTGWDFRRNDEEEGAVEDDTVRTPAPSQERPTT